MTLNVAILGASGYTGAEAIRLLANHPEVKITQLVAESNAGKPIGELYSHLGYLDLPDLIKFDQLDTSELDVVFGCLPHGASHQLLKTLPENILIVDLSADFRLTKPLYDEWYGTHEAEDMFADATYALPELFADNIKEARILACPGCYPTSIILPLHPLVHGGLVKKESIIADAKSGVTGAGRGVKLPFLFTEANENFKAYGVGKHRHVAEMDAYLETEIRFTPHLVPMNRGILSTIYVDLEDGKTVVDLRNALETAYGDKPFVRLYPEGQLPTTRDMNATNMIGIAVTEERIAGKAIIVSAIDNLTKGSSGQAVQAMNIKLGFDETLGLENLPVFP